MLYARGAGLRAPARAERARAAPARGAAPAEQPGRVRRAPRGSRGAAIARGSRDSPDEALAPIGADAARARPRWIERAAARRSPSASIRADAPTRAGALLRALAGGRHVAPRRVAARARSRDSGTTHLLSVSGTHIVWVFWLTRFVRRVRARAQPRARRWCARARGIAVVAGAAAGCGYAFLCGLEPPALRSAAMAAAGALALLGGRPATSWNALALAGAASCSRSIPAALFEPRSSSRSPRSRGSCVWRPPPGALRGLAHASLGAGLASAPLAAELGAPLPAGWLVANALAVPYFGVAVVPPALVAGVLGGALPAASRAGARAGRARHPRPRGARDARTCSRVRATGSRSPALLAALAFALRALAHSGARRRSRARRGRGGGAACPRLAARERGGRRARGRVPRRRPRRRGRWCAPAARAWLVDAGTRAAGWDAGRAVVLPALRALGVRRLDALALTHADLDHVGGAPAVLDALPVGELWLTRSELRRAGPARAAASCRAPPRCRAADRRGGRRARRAPSSAIAALWPPADFARADDERELARAAARPARRLRAARRRRARRGRARARARALRAATC